MIALTILSALAHVALAANRPTPPPMGENKAITGGKSAVEFFTPRLANTDCLRELAEAEKNEARALTEFKRAKEKGISGSEVDTYETDWRRERSAALKVVEECGPCVSAPVSKVVVEGVSRREVWYVAEAACQYLPTADSGTTRAGFEAAWKSLKKVASYGKKTGGFEPMLEFLPVDLKTGQLLPNVVDIAPVPFPAVLGLKATEFLGTTFAYRQLVELQFEEKLAGDRMEAGQVTIKNIPIPSGFNFPEITDLTAGGQAKRVALKNVSVLNAVWYLNADGYVRYYMAGEFGSALPFANESGRSSAREVIYDLYKRAF